MVAKPPRMVLGGLEGVAEGEGGGVKETTSRGVWVMAPRERERVPPVAPGARVMVLLPTSMFVVRKDWEFAVAGLPRRERVAVPGVLPEVTGVPPRESEGEVRMLVVGEVA